MTTTTAGTAPAASPAPAFTRAAVEALSARRQEPEWLRRFRLDAFAAYEQLPFPTGRERAWKYLNPRRLRLGEITLDPPAAAPADGQPASGAYGAEGEHAALIVQRDGVTVIETVSEELRAAGVIVLSMERALVEQEERVRAALMSRALRPETNAFSALHAAFFEGGLFIYVPREVEVALPIHLVLEHAGANAALFPHLLVVLERNARLTLVEERSGTTDAGGFCNGVSEFLLGDGAALQHYAVQRWGAGMRDVTMLRTQLGPNARLTSLCAGLGGDVMKWWVEAAIEGAGADSTMLGVFFGAGKQHHDVITTQDHIGPQTTSDLLYKTALKDESVGAYYGLTRVGPEARGTAANQENRNLLLSPKAKADADPVLEILTSDVVRCGHGASAGPVDQDQLFYMETRGLPRPAAEKLLVGGFLNEVVERIPLESVRLSLSAEIEAKIEAGGS